MEKEKPLWEGRMRKAEAKAFYYELPIMAAALLIGSGVGALYAFVVNHFQLFFYPNVPLLIFLGLALIGLGLVFWGASYYPRRVEVFADRLRFVMLFGNRVIKKDAIVSLTALTLEQTRSTFFSLRYINLTTAVQGAIMLKKNKGRIWVFSPEPPEEFLAAAKGIMEGIARQGGDDGDKGADISDQNPPN